MPPDPLGGWQAFAAGGLAAEKIQMDALVEQMLAARKQLAAAQSDKGKDFYTHRCDGLDRQIDAVGDVLYALTPAEIKIVEGAK